MRDEEKIKGQFIKELTELRKRIAVLEKSEAAYKRIEKTLNFERQQLLSIFESIDEVIYVSDPETYEILYVNRVLKEKRDDVIGQKCYRTFQALESPCSFCTNKFIFGKNMGRTHIWEFQNKVDHRWYHCIDKAIRWPDGRMVRYEMAIDITRNRKLEEQLRHAQKMEAVGALTGSLAHEFNNILTLIIGCGEFLQDRIDENDPLRDYVDMIHDSAEKAANLTQSLLIYSRKHIMHQKLLSLNKIMERVKEILSRLIGENIELKIMLKDEDLTIMADGNQIEQVLLNLAINARDAMPGGGVLTIGTELVEVDGKFIKTRGYGDPGVYALISVTDTGEGMDRRTKDKIFEPFFSTKDIGKGTGLGLSVVYGIVKGHGGYIDVYSEPSKGTTFKIYFPINKTDIGEPQPVTAESVPAGGAETILFAEDDADVRNIIKTELEMSGYKVITAINGDDAIKKFKRHSKEIQLLLFDVVMPKKNGMEVYSEIRKIKPDIKALFISGYSDDVVHSTGVFSEGLHFISKPVSQKKFLRKVREVLEESL